MSIRDTMLKQERPKRIPVSDSRNILTVTGDIDRENFQFRWVNDIDDRISRFLAGGYNFVNAKDLTVGDGGNVDWKKSDASIVRKPVGRGVTAYLMAIPKEFFEEDQAAKQRKVDETEEAMTAAVNEQNNYGKLELKGPQGTRISVEKKPK